MRYLAHQTKKQYPSIFKQLQLDLTQIGQMSERAFLEQQIQVQTTDFSRTFNSALTMLNVLFDNPNGTLEFKDESNEFLLPMYQIDKDLVSTGSSLAIPNLAPLYLVNNVPKFFDYSLQLGTKCACPGIDNTSSALEEAKVIQANRDFSFVNAAIKDLNIDLTESDEPVLLCYKVANFIKQSYESDASFNEDPKNAAYFKGTENYRKLDECYQIGTLVMFGDLSMIKTFTSPHMLQILKSLEERVGFDPNK